VSKFDDDLAALYQTLLKQKRIARTILTEFAYTGKVDVPSAEDNIRIIRELYEPEFLRTGESLGAHAFLATSYLTRAINYNMYYDDGIDRTYDERWSIDPGSYGVDSITLNARIDHTGIANIHIDPPSYSHYDEKIAAHQKLAEKLRQRLGVRVEIGPRPGEPHHGFH
jgi:hypothetical protein